MTRWWLAGGVTAIAAGFLLGVLAAFPRVVPEASWAGSTPGAAGRWTLAAVGIGVMYGGAMLLRVGRRRARRSPDTFLTRDEEERVLAAVAEFERRSSGEIRVHLARSAGDDILATARETFERLGMTATKERNGVLFYVAVEPRRFAVIGDQGIHAVVGEGFWDEIVAHVRDRFREGAYGDGLVEGIGMAGEALAAHFPVAPDDINELPDQISREE